MADGSPTPRRGRDRRPGRRGRPAEHLGDRCPMCRRKVTVDAQGRCPLGHQVVAPEVVRERAAARGAARDATLRRAGDDAAAGSADGGLADAAPDPIVASYEETRRTSPLATGGAPASWSSSSRLLPAGSDAPVADASTPDPPTADAPTPDAPSPRPRSTAPATPPYGMSAVLPVLPADPLPREVRGEELEPQPVVYTEPLPVRTPPAPGPQATRRLFTDGATSASGPPATAAPATAAHAQPHAPPHAPAPERQTARPSSATGSWDPDTRTAGGRAAVPLGDLAPTARSALDVDVPAWSTPVPRPEPTYAQEPLADPELEPPRGLVQLVGGAVFLLALLAIAWYLATSL